MTRTECDDRGSSVRTVGATSKPEDAHSALMEMMQHMMGCSMMSEQEVNRSGASADPQPV